MATVPRPLPTPRSIVRRLIGSQLQESALPDRLKVGEALRLFWCSDSGAPSWEETLRLWGRIALNEDYVLHLETIATRGDRLVLYCLGAADDAIDTYV